MSRWQLTAGVARNRHNAEFLLTVRQLFPWVMCLIVVGSFCALIPVAGLRVAIICVLALLPSCVVAIGWIMQEELFDPLGGVWISLFLGTGLRAVYLASSSSDRVDYLMWQLSFDDLATGAFISTLGALAITAGYIAGGRIALPIRSSPVVGLNQQRLFWVSVLLGAIAIIVAADFFRRTGLDLSSGISGKRRAVIDGHGPQSFASLGYHLWFASTIPSVCFYFWSWEFLRSRSNLALLMGLAFFLLAAGFGFLTSSRTVICYLLVNFLYLANSFRSLRLGHLVLVSALVFAIVSVMLTLRTMNHQNSGPKTLTDSLSVDVVVDSVLGNENFSDLGRLTLIHRSVPDRLEYKYGMSYLLWLVAPIPRTYWSEKPILSQGLEITEKVYGGKWTSKGIQGGGHPPGFIAEVVMNFGLLGVPFCGAIYGVVLRWFQNFYLKNPRSNVLISVFILMPISYELMGGEFSRQLIDIASGVIPAILLLAFTANRLHGRIAFDTNGGV